MLSRQFHYCVCHAARRMPHHVLFAGKVAGDALYSQLFNPLDVRHNRSGAFRRVAHLRLH